MQLDPSIILGYKPPQIESPTNVLAKFLELDNAQQANQLNAMKLSEARDASAKRNRLAALLNQDYASDDERENALTRGGFHAEANDMRKSRADLSKSMAEAEGKNFDIANKRFNAYRQVMTGLMNAPDLSKEMVATAGHELVSMGIMPAQMLMTALQSMPDDPNLIRAKIRQGLIAQMDADQALTALSPKPERIDNGQQISFRDLNPNSTTYGQTTGGAPVQKLQSPESIASNRVAMRGQDLVNARSKEANDIASGAVVSKRVQEVEMKLQDDYRTESKGFAETSTAMKKILGAIENADRNPGDALSAGTAFMKLLDPNSVVRETELGMALNASGWFDRASNIANTLQRGRVMTPTQKANLKASAQGLFNEAKAAQREIDAAYEQRAKAYGADPNRVIVDRGQRSADNRPAALPSMDAIEAELARRSKGAR